MLSSNVKKSHKNLHFFEEPEKNVWVVFNDCNLLIKEVKDNSIDLIATDPPYEINFEKNDWDKQDILNWYFLGKEFKRVLKPGGALIVFQGWSNVSSTIEILNNFFLLKNWIIYDRIKGRGAKTNLVSTREDILWFLNDKNKYTFNKISSTIKKATGGSIGKKNGNPYRAMSNVWTDISPIVPWSKERVKHPTQKPLAIMERILNIFSNEGDLILNPFCGSGTTGVAAIKTGRKFIGFENDKNYFRIIKERISDF